MKNNFLLFAILLFLTSCFVSCSNDSDSIIDDGGIIEEPKSYRMASIQWKLGENDSVEHVIKKEKEVIYNYEDTAKLVEYYTLGEVRQTSYFQCEEKDLEFLRKWLDKDLLVTVPISPESLTSEYSSWSGVGKAPLEFMKENDIDLETTKVHSKIKLSPKSKITVDRTLFFKKAIATFRIKFVAEEDKSEVVEIVGKWKGLIYDHGVPKETIGSVE